MTKGCPTDSVGHPFVMGEGQLFAGSPFGSFFGAGFELAASTNA